MNVLKNENEKIYFFENFIDKKECDYWISLSKKIPKNIREKYNYSDNLNERNELWEYRTTLITQSYIVSKTENFLNKSLNINLQIQEAEIQNWIVGSFSKLHSHKTCLFRNSTNISGYNSVLYLNNDFEGGEFFTKNGLKIKPKPGLLTLFDGKNIEHGLKKVLNKDRFTIIFWWK